MSYRVTCNDCRFKTVEDLEKCAESLRKTHGFVSGGHDIEIEEVSND